MFECEGEMWDYKTVCQTESELKEHLDYCFFHELDFIIDYDGLTVYSRPL
jgi:hypothetical protein